MLLGGGNLARGAMLLGGGNLAQGRILLWGNKFTLGRKVALGRNLLGEAILLGGEVSQCELGFALG